MTCPPFIREALEKFIVCVDDGQRIAVPTQCLYPSNAVVTVYVTGGPNSCVVSDEGRAIQEIVAHGFEVPNADPYLRQFTASRGLRIDKGKIYSPPISADALPTAISLVATISSLAAFWGVRTFRTRVRRDLRQELRDLLEARFTRDRVREEIHLTGLSGRSYRFEFQVELGKERALILDSIFPEATAINTRTIAHFDLKQTNNTTFVQRMVYDDADNWVTSDLNLLRMAAELVPLPQFNHNLDIIGIV